MRKGRRRHRCGPFPGARSASLMAACVAAAIPRGAALAQQAPSTGGAQPAPVQQAPSAGTSAAGTGTNAVSLPEIKVIGTTPLAPSRPAARPAAAPAATAPAAPAAASAAAPKAV